MKTFKHIIILSLILFLIQSCNERVQADKPEDGNSVSTFELKGKDTINVTDSRGHKLGRWITSPYQVKTEEGFYKDNKKEGVWKKFSASGQLTDSLFYRNDTLIIN